MESPDSLAELRGEGHAGSLGSLTPAERTWRRVKFGGGAAEGKVKVKGHEQGFDEAQWASSLVTAVVTGQRSDQHNRE